ncbi:MAG: methionine adenosyltransferase [Acidiferrobacterales bacterium]
MALEAVAGKNAVTHVGKLYNLVARTISGALVSELGEIRVARCAPVSRIGQPAPMPRKLSILRSLRRMRGSIRGCAHASARSPKPSFRG